mgnify:CR=1 FL=1
MEGLLLILLIVILILVIGTKNRMAAVERELQTTRLQMQELMKMLAKRVAGERGPETQAYETAAPQARPEPVTPEPPSSLAGIPLEHERFVGAVEEEKPPIITPPRRCKCRAAIFTALFWNSNNSFSNRPGKRNWLRPARASVLR